MNKLLATLIASLFAVSTAFAASHTGAPMAGASAPKAEAQATKKTVKKAKKAKKAKKVKAEETKS
ncbi:hypothetical protein ACFPOE_19685 [Caenimonas terrae]|uniref:Acid-shock protein n=1 Tax=Caenimonas terrae TaxID=696074 RepID=A0ABW0NJ62_9BURK